jgi:methylmalonyl-CoA mutase, N-terminal domain
MSGSSWAASCFDHDYAQWRADYSKQIRVDRRTVNRSGFEIKPLYTPRDWDGSAYEADLGFPGQYPFTRGIYPTMHRGRTWTRRQLIGLGTPEDYNARVRQILAAGATAISFLPYNSGFRGVDCDEVDPLLLGTCGTVSNTVDDMDAELDGVPLGEISVAMNDPSPFTLLAFTPGVAKRRGVAWERISGTSNQSDYISHFIANHMFYRLSLPGSRRVLIDHVAFCLERLPNWNPISVVGQHMQQAGATPAETVGFTFSTALQYADDCAARGIDIDVLLRRFTFFFDISISFFEEIAKFRAARRIWARLARERLGAKNPNFPALQVPRPDVWGRPHAPAAAQQHRPRHDAGDGGNPERPAIDAHRRLRRGSGDADGGDRAYRGGDPEYPARRGASV